MRYTLNVNGQDCEVDVDQDASLLWVLRNTLNLKGTRYGCGKGVCGSCTVHLDGAPVQACQTPVACVGAAKIVTIEGIGDTAVGKRVTAAWMKVKVTHCGYCQGGQIMAATALLAKKPHPSDEDIETAMKGHLCRCGTTLRVKQAIKLAAEEE